MVVSDSSLLGNVRNYEQGRKAPPTEKRRESNQECEA
jgi:hypothetical protein